MSFDLSAARDFMAAHARVLDRRRFELLTERTDAAAVLAALDAYRNADGGYGWGLEPDLRSPESQPAAAHHAFEVFEEIAPTTAPEAKELCDWLASVTLPDGGLPFALPVRVSAGSAPFWTAADPSQSSLQITAVVAGAAHRVATRPGRGRAPVAGAGHESLRGGDRGHGATAVRLRAGFSVRFVDALHESRPAEAERLLGRLGEFVPPDGKLRVTGGTEDETLHPLDMAPHPGRPARTLFPDEVVAADLERLAALQQDDGGWIVDFRSGSPAAALEWRGYTTVRAIDILDRSLGASARPAP
jgi:hypothetical protein